MTESDRLSYAASLRAVPYSRIRELGELAMTMEGVLRLHFGESSSPTPAFIVDSAVRALRDGHTFYSENAGLPVLRRAIAEQYRRLHGVEVDPETQLVITASGLQGLHLALRAAVDPGDEAIVLSPAWPNGGAIVRMAHGVLREVPLRLDGAAYRLDLDRVVATLTPRTRAILLTSPSNPLGWVATVDEQRQLLDLCRERGIWLVCDEVYERLWYEGAELGEPAPSILRLCRPGDPVHVVQSFSKTYCMTGWRVGWIVTRPDVGPKLAELNEFFVSHAATFSQHAAVTALQEGEDELVAMLGRLKANRDLCLDVLGSIPGVTVPAPAGAFYVFPRLEGLGDSFAFCKRLLMEERVSVAPGSAFGAGGEGSIRLCYASDGPIVEEALHRLQRFVAAGVRE